MSHQDVLNRLTTIFRELSDEDDVVLVDSTTAEDVPGWDSIFHVKFVIAIEQAFKVRFDASEINAAANVGELAAMIESKLLHA